MSTHEQIIRKYPRCIATISAGFEKGDFLVREEKGQRVYFDFFEEAFNYIAAKGYSRMPKGEEGEWMDLMVRILLRFLSDLMPYYEGGVGGYRVAELGNLVLFAYELQLLISPTGHVVIPMLLLVK